MRPWVSLVVFALLPGALLAQDQQGTLLDPQVGGQAGGSFESGQSQGDQKSDPPKKEDPKKEDPKKEDPKKADPQKKEDPPKKPPIPPAQGGGTSPVGGKTPGFTTSPTPTQQGGINDPSRKKGKTLIDWFNEQVLQRITATGSRRLRYQVNTVEGDGEAFNLQTSYGLGAKRWVDVGNISLQGQKVLGVFNFNATIQDSRFRDPQEQKFSLDYQTGPVTLNLGDIQGRLLNSNQFATFNKSLRGGSISYAKDGLEARFLQTEVRGEARTVSIAGANTSGPYYLQSSQIIRGSESIQVDGVQQEFGRDYTIDYDLGAISFVNRSTAEGKVISPTSVIVATYETLGISGIRGRLLGGSAGYAMGKLGRISATYLTQKSGGDNRLSTRLESFQGFGAPGTPYVLQFTPLTGSPLTIRIDGALQVEGVDYTIDPGNRAIFYFTRFVPSTSNIDVLYTPNPTTTVNGDREVVGLDYSLPLGKGGTVSVDWARGRLTNTPTPSTGDAKGVEVRYTAGRGSVFSSLRDVPSTFVGIESIGFNRAEKTGDLRLEYRPLKGWTTGLSHRTSSITQFTTGTGGKVNEVDTRFILTQAVARFQPTLPGSSPLEFSQTRTISRAAAGETASDTTALSTARRFGRLTTRLELSYLSAKAPDPAAVGTRQTLTRQGVELRSSYDAGETLNASLSASLSRLALKGEQGTGRDLQATLAWRPRQDFSANFTWSDSDAGKISQIAGFSSGYGYGYDGNSFSSGSTGGFIGGASSQTRTGLNANWRPSDNLSLGVGAYLSRSRGSVTSNSETKSGLIGLDWDPAEWLRVNGTLNISQSRFIGASSTSTASGWSFGIDGSPAGRLSFALGASGLSTGGNAGAFQQDIIQYDASASWRLRQRHVISALWSGGETKGYLPQSTGDLSLVYRYQIWQTLALNTSYRWSDVTNTDGGGGSGAYKARGFAVELAFNFGRF